MSGKLSDDCFRHDFRLMAHGAAIEELKRRTRPIVGSAPVALEAASGRILATAPVAPHPVPNHTNAAVDGYAFAARDYDRRQGSVLSVAGRAAAGRPFAQEVPPRAAVRIFTGAVMPAGLDTVAMQEDCEELAGPGLSVRIPAGIKPGANVRKAGEDVRQGETLLSVGHVLRPQDLAALASIGLCEVTCYRQLRVAICSTGNEVVRPGAAPLPHGSVFDANAPMLVALVRLAGGQAKDLGVWPDRLEEVKKRLGEAAREQDVILTTGGASRGEEDHVAQALAALGSRHFWQIAVKPGRPMMFGQIGEAVVIGLPGNPVAVFVCFLMYVWPLLRSLAGAPWPEPRRLEARAAFDFPNRKTGRREYWRGMLRETAEGLAVDKFARDGSGLISGLRAADCLIEVPEEVPAVAAGDRLTVIPFSEFGILR
ncbi:MAG TPA: gephyrin-like molybdotransferase Glp [Hyphomicrobiaceae bacterium]|nr:gephyrin-like molybdotransferase Glp [Hyphomicrobiaceae bacterium]